MTERSMFFTDGSGDGGPYSQDALRLFLKAFAIAPGANEGVLPGQLNEFQIKTTGNNNVTIGTGRAIVDGTLYENDVASSNTITSPSGGTTGKRLVLRKSWSARTVRITEVSSPDGTGTLPSITQSDGVTWDVPICSFTITTGGVIGALTDEREWVSLGFDQLAMLRHTAYERTLVAWHDFIVADNPPTNAVPIPGALGLYYTRANTGPTHVASSDPSNGKIDLATSTTANTVPRFYSSLAVIKGSLNPRYMCSCIPQAANAALTFQIFGFFSSTTPAAGTGSSKACVRSVTTGNMFFVTGDGATEQTTDLGAPPTSQTVYEIRTDDAGVTWLCYVNGVLKASHATTIPAASTAMHVMFGLSNNTTTSMAVTNLDYIMADQARG